MCVPLYMSSGPLLCVVPQLEGPLTLVQGCPTWLAGTRHRNTRSDNSMGELGKGEGLDQIGKGRG